MVSSSLNLSFKGYDAASLKSIRFSDYFIKPYAFELQTVCDSENINFKPIENAPQWFQDSEVILEGEGKPRLVASSEIDIKEHIDSIKAQKLYNAEFSEHYIKGGDVFLGKYPNGEYWMLTGNEGAYNEHLDEISKLYNVKSENIHFIPNQNFHLDMYIRPIGYPYILVNDDKLCTKHLNSIQGKKSDIKDFRAQYEEYNKKRKKRYKATTDDVCKKLQSLGFIPIRVAGVWGGSVNFMNAIVNLHPDKTFSYITSSSKCKNPYISELEAVFEKSVREQVSNLDKMYFIKGQEDKNNKTSGNKIMQSLSYYHGGLHCMCLEEPNFDTLA